jgi:hypothetical protein
MCASPWVFERGSVSVATGGHRRQPYGRKMIDKSITWTGQAGSEDGSRDKAGVASICSMTGLSRPSSP